VSRSRNLQTTSAVNDEKRNGIRKDCWHRPPSNVTVRTFCNESTAALHDSGPLHRCGGRLDEIFQLDFKESITKRF
jgi:hypothetical protein